MSKNYNISETSELSIEEKLEMIDSYSIADLEIVLSDIESFPDEYDKQVKIAVYNKLFEYGITSI